MANPVAGFLFMGEYNYMRHISFAPSEAHGFSRGSVEEHMKIRNPALPQGWYPPSRAETGRLFENWTGKAEYGRALAVLAPHAGWTYSGRIAALAWADLAQAETIAIIGGHLGASSPVLIALEEGFSVFSTVLPADMELRDRLSSELTKVGIGFAPDERPDNTVEVHLPFLAHRFPAARLLWLRAPSGETSLGLGRALHAAATALRRSVAVVGSSDLTHYGPDYGFEPRGGGREAEDWVRDVNDRGFLDKLIALDGRAALDHANRQHSACSAGGAVAALSFSLAEASGTGPKPSARLLGYSTSRDVRPAESFVGYGAVGFYRGN